MGEKVGVVGPGPLASAKVTARRLGRALGGVLGSSKKAGLLRTN